MIKYIPLTFLFVSISSSASAIQCTSSSTISPFSVTIKTTNGVSGYVSPNIQLVRLISENKGVKTIIPPVKWSLINAKMTWDIYGNIGNEFYDTNPTLENDAYKFSSAIGNYYFTSLDASIQLNSEVNGERLLLSIEKQATNASDETVLSGYSVTPGKSAQWDIPLSVDVGQLVAGSHITRILPGPIGAKGIITGYDIEDNSDFVRINGCGKGCSSQVEEGDEVSVVVSPPLTIPSGQYKFIAEAILTCD